MKWKETITETFHSTFQTTTTNEPKQERYSNCRELLDERLQVQWELQGDWVQIQLAARIRDDQYMSFGLSGESGRSSMVGGDVVVAFYDTDRGAFRAEDYYMSATSQVCSVCFCTVEQWNATEKNKRVTHWCVTVRWKKWSVSRHQNRRTKRHCTGKRWEEEWSDHHCLPSIVANKWANQRSPHSQGPGGECDSSHWTPQQQEGGQCSRNPRQNNRWIAFRVDGQTRDVIIQCNNLSFVDDIRIDFSSRFDHTCATSLYNVKEEEAIKPWPPNVIIGEKVFSVRIGPTGGKRGYTPITGKCQKGTIGRIKHEKWKPYISGYLKVIRLGVLLGGSMTN